MKKYLYILFFLGFIVEAVIYWDIYTQKNKAVVLGEDISVTSTPTSMSSPTITPTITSTPTSTPTPTRTPTQIPTPITHPDFTSEQIYEFINRFAGQYGVSPDILRYIAICESGFNAKASNGIYGGLFQFNANTWANFRRQIGEDANASLRFNAEEAVQTAAYVLQVNKAYIWPNCIP